MGSLLSKKFQVLSLLALSIAGASSGTAAAAEYDFEGAVQQFTEAHREINGRLALADLSLQGMGDIASRLMCMSPRQRRHENLTRERSSYQSLKIGFLRNRLPLCRAASTRQLGIVRDFERALQTESRRASSFDVTESELEELQRKTRISEQMKATARSQRSRVERRELRYRRINEVMERFGD